MAPQKKRGRPTFNHEQTMTGKRRKEFSDSGIAYWVRSLAQDRTFLGPSHAEISL